MERLLLVAIAFLNLMLLGSSRLTATIRLVALQGTLLGLLPLFSPEHGFEARAYLLAVVIVGLKGLGFPWLLSRAVREADVRREMEPFVGYIASVLLGFVLLALSLSLATRLPLNRPLVNPLVVPIGLFTILTGFLIIVSRKKALTQVLGYLVLENGIFAFGLALATEQPFLVEMGVLLDAFVAVFVMGITIFHMNREFDSIDTDRLSSLKDW